MGPQFYFSPSSLLSVPWAVVQTGSLITCPLHRGMHPAKYNVLVGGEPVIVGLVLHSRLVMVSGRLRARNLQYTGLESFVLSCSCVCSHLNGKGSPYMFLHICVCMHTDVFVRICIEARGSSQESCLVTLYLIF